MQLKLTKNALREEQVKLLQLNQYLPTLELKKAMLQLEMTLVKNAIDKLLEELEKEKEKSLQFCELLSQEDIIKYIEVQKVNKKCENIAGIDMPCMVEEVVFNDMTYSLFDSPVWMEAVILQMRGLATLREKINVAYEKKTAIQKELKDVSIRVNLFKKVLIPRIKTNMKKIKIFLEDQQLAEISRSKIAKEKKIRKKNDY